MIWMNHILPLFSGNGFEIWFKIFLNSTPARAYQPILVDGFDLIWQNIIYFMDDRKLIIVYAITIAVLEAISLLLFITRKGLGEW